MPDTSKLATPNSPLPGANTGDSTGVSSPQAEKTPTGTSPDSSPAPDTSSQWEGTVYGRVDGGVAARKDLFGYDEFRFEPDPKISATFSGTVGAELSRDRLGFRLGVTGRVINPSTYTYEGDYRDLVIHTAPENRLGFVPDSLELGGEFGPFYHVSDNVSVGLLTGLRFYLSPTSSNIGVNHTGEFIGTVPDGSPDAHNPLGGRALWIGPQACYGAWCLGVNSSFRQKTESDERLRDRRIENSVTLGWQGHFGRKAAAPVARPQEPTAEATTPPPSAPVEPTPPPAEPTPTLAEGEEGPPIISTEEPTVTKGPLPEEIDLTTEAAEKQKISTEIQDFNREINSIDFVEIEKYIESLTQKEADALFDSDGHLMWSHVEHLLNSATDLTIVSLAGNYLAARLYERYLELHSEKGQAEREIYENALREWKSFSKPRLEKVGLVTLSALPDAMGVLVYQSESWMKNPDEVPLDELRNRQGELKGVEQYEAALLATLLGLVEKVAEWKLDVDRKAAAAAEREKQEMPVQVAKQVTAARQEPSPKDLEQALLPLINYYFENKGLGETTQIAKDLTAALMQASHAKSDEERDKILKDAIPSDLEKAQRPSFRVDLLNLSRAVKEGKSIQEINAQIVALLKRKEEEAEPTSTPLPGAPSESQPSSTGLKEDAEIKGETGNIATAVYDESLKRFDRGDLDREWVLPWAQSQMESSLEERLRNISNTISSAIRLHDINELEESGTMLLTYGFDAQTGQVTTFLYNGTMPKRAMDWVADRARQAKIPAAQTTQAAVYIQYELKFSNGAFTFEPVGDYTYLPEPQQAPVNLGLPELRNGTREGPQSPLTPEAQFEEQFIRGIVGSGVSKERLISLLLSDLDQEERQKVEKALKRGQHLAVKVTYQPGPAEGVSISVSDLKDDENETYVKGQDLLLLEVFSSINIGAYRAVTIILRLKNMNEYDVEVTVTR